MTTTLDTAPIRDAFPILRESGAAAPLVYLDNAATTQKPDCVIDAVSRFYRRDNANVHRGVHALGHRATTAFEDARQRVRQFINAADAGDIVFTSGATEAINLVAHAFAERFLAAGDEIVVTELAHHANFVPWQVAAARHGATLRVIPATDSCDLDLDAYEGLLGPRTRLVAVGHVTNVTGTVHDLPRIIAAAHRRDIPVLVDGAQAVARLPVDVRQLGCDFYAFSGHKAYGPTGIGVLYGTRARMSELPPWRTGGGMVDTVTITDATWQSPPHRFEAGTPNIAGAIGLAAALEFLQQIGMARVAAHERRLLDHALARLEPIPGVRCIGAPVRRTGIVSMACDRVHPHDLATLLSDQGIATRAGHHCAQPLMRRLGLAATLRASFGIYNTTADIDRLADALPAILEVFR